MVYMWRVMRVMRVWRSVDEDTVKKGMGGVGCNAK